MLSGETRMLEGGETLGETLSQMVIEDKNNVMLNIMQIGEGEGREVVRPGSVVHSLLSHGNSQSSHVSYQNT